MTAEHERRWLPESYLELVDILYLSYEIVLEVKYFKLGTQLPKEFYFLYVLLM